MVLVRGKGTRENKWALGYITIISKVWFDEGWFLLLIEAETGNWETQIYDLSGHTSTWCAYFTSNDELSELYGHLVGYYIGFLSTISFFWYICWGVCVCGSDQLGNQTNKLSSHHDFSSNLDLSESNAFLDTM